MEMPRNRAFCRSTSGLPDVGVAGDSPPLLPTLPAVGDTYRGLELKVVPVMLARVDGVNELAIRRRGALRAKKRVTGQCSIDSALDPDSAQAHDHWCIARLS